MDFVDRLERSIAQAQPMMAGTAESQFGLPTPCTEWAVRDLLNHMIGTLVMFRDAANKGEADLGAMGADHAAAGAAETFATVAKETLAALRAKGSFGTITLPFGELPCEFAYQLVANDILVHGWDLATATGQRVDWDQNLAAETLAFARAGIADPQIRGDEFAAPVACAEEADAMTQLVSFLGRTP